MQSCNFKFYSEFLKLKNLYDLVHFLTEDHRITKTKTAAPSSRRLPQNVASHPTEKETVFEKFIFPPAGRGGRRTL